MSDAGEPNRDTETIFGGDPKDPNINETPAEPHASILSDLTSENSDNDLMPSSPPVPSVVVCSPSPPIIDGTEHTDTIDKRELMEIDPHGDLRLLVGHNDETGLTFLVSRKALSLSSGVWKAMLYGRFVEQSQNAISLPEDKPEPLKILLNISHLQFAEVPDQLSFEALHRLAIMCDKYDMAHIVAPLVAGWLKSHKYSPDFDDSATEWLTVAWVFRYKDTFELIANEWLRFAEISTNNKFYKSGYTLSEELPIGLIESMRETRSHAIQDHLDICYTLLDELENDTFRCKGRTSKSQSSKCEALLLGSYQRVLRKIGLWPKRKTADEIYVSLTYFKVNLKSIENELHWLQGHNSCLYKMLPDFFRHVPFDLPSPLTDRHRQHFGPKT